MLTGYNQELLMLSDPCTSRYVRHVSGEVVSALTVQTSVARIEIFRRRQSDKEVEWQFCQPEMTLFWHRQGFRRMQGSVDGSRVDCDFAGGSTLSLFAPEAQIRTAFETGEHCDYVAVFFDRAKVLEKFGIELHTHKVGFNSEALRRGLAEICREAEQPDDMFDLFAQGWVLQTLAHVNRVARTNAASFLPKGGLPARTVKKLESYVRENIGSEIRLEALSSLAGLSKRHFLRAFSQSLGTTPHRYVLAHRIDAAKQRLAQADSSITEVALESGFTHAQHFSTAFRRVTGQTPSEYRSRLRG
jgi:AraC family transcriptional regulator